MQIVTDWFKRNFSDPQVTLLMLVVICAVLLVTFFGEMLAPAIAAIVIAFLLDGPVTWLKRRGARHIFAVSSVFLLFMLGMLMVVLAVLPPLVKQIIQFVNDTPRMLASLQVLVTDLQEKFPEMISPEQAQTWLSSIGTEITNMGPELVQYSLSGVAGAITAVVYLVLVPVMVFFFLKDKPAIFAFIIGFLPKERSLVNQVFREGVDRAGDYARGKVYEIIIVGLVSFFIYRFIGLQYATLLAVATGLSVIIPYIGAAVVTLPVALVALFQWGVGPDFTIAVIAYLVLQALDGNLLAPLLFSEVVKLHPNAIILAILVFGGIWGLWGVFFAIPLATVANAILRAWRERTNHMMHQEIEKKSDN